MLPLIFFGKCCAKFGFLFDIIGNVRFNLSDLFLQAFVTSNNSFGRYTLGLSGVKLITRENVCAKIGLNVLLI